MLDRLVDDGTITDEQEEEILSAFESMLQSGEEQPPSEPFDSYTESKTDSGDQYSDWSAYTYAVKAYPAQSYLYDNSLWALNNISTQM